MKSFQMFPFALVLFSSFFIPQAQAAGTCGSSADGVGTTHCTGSNPWTADSVSYEDLNQCVNTCATYEDTVNVPAGTSNWGTKQLTITKGINLLGAGKGSTVINSAPSTYSTSTYLIKFDADQTTAANDYQFKLDGFTLQANGTEPPYALLVLNNNYLTNELTKVIISNNKFKQLVSSGDSCMAILLNLAVFGVTYNNEIVDGSHAWRFMGNIGAGKQVEYWEPGSKYAMYFEDNEIYVSTQWSTALVVSGGGGNRYVSRYNTWTLMNDPNKYSQAFDIHGNQGNNPGAGIGIEIYGNKRIGMAGQWFGHRGGRVTFFYNQWTNTTGSGYYSVFEEYNDDTYIATSCVGYQYPQTPSGNCVQAPREGYYWRNFVGIDGTTLVTTITHPYDHFNRDTGQVNDPLTLFENQDWWRDNNAEFTGAIDPIGSCGYYQGPSCSKSGIGCGTLATRPTTCTTGVGYWATDQSCSDLTGMVGTNPSTPISGTLYKCTSTNTWTAYYTPYTYPHPLRLESPAQTCGNNIREGSETCDGTDLAGQTCVSRGFTGGTISCSSNCLSFVTTSCTSQQACPNGICGAGETCSSCPQDCGACSSSGLIAWWKLDETSGTTASDSSGSSTGTLVNGPVWTAGNLSNGLSFDGVNDYVDISGVASLIDKNQGSFAAWILIDRYFTSTLPSNYGIIEVGSSVSSNNGITLSPNPTASAIIMHYRNNGVSTISSASVPTGAWHHVVGTWTASALTIYVDGVLVDSDSNGAITTATLNQARIGSDGLGTTGQAFFDGSIDDVRIYNRALNASEIQALYQSGSSIHKSDNNPADGCVSMEELTAFISLWYLDSSNPSLKELIEAIGLWKRGGC